MEEKPHSTSKRSFLFSTLNRRRAGRRSHPAAFPTYFQIRDVGPRAVEFLMALETHEMELMRHRLELFLAENKVMWSAKLDEMQTAAGHVGAKPEGLPEQPTIVESDIERAFLRVAEGEHAIPQEEATAALRARLVELGTAETASVKEISDATAAELERVTRSLGERNARRASLHRARQAELVQKASIDRRITALEEDLQKNLDAQKLRNFGSRIAEVSADHCPTCSQPIHDTLLAQNASAKVMPVEDNIEYIRSQRGIFTKLLAQSESAIAQLETLLAAATREVYETSAHLRALRADIVAPSHAASAAAIEERLRLETCVFALDEAQHRFEQHKSALVSLGIHRREFCPAG